MKFIKPSVSLIKQEPGVDGMKKHIELCGKVSYKSEDKITEESYKQFTEMLTKRGHLSPFEHGTVYLDVPMDDNETIFKFVQNPYSTVLPGPEMFRITTNYRVILENQWQDIMEKYWSDGEHCVPRVTFHIICSRGVSHELVRHRVFSFTQESTRYCNYSTDKHESQVKFIIPSWIDDIADGECFTKEDIEVDKVVQALLNKKRSEKTMMLISNHVCSETVYLEMIKQNATPQQARDVLPNGLKTEVMMTGTVLQWKEFLKLRSPKYGATGMHPDMAVIADMVYEDLVEEELIKPKENDKDD